MITSRVKLACMFAMVMTMVSSPLFALQDAKPDLNRPLTTEPVGLIDYVQMFFGLALILGIIFGMA